MAVDQQRLTRSNGSTVLARPVADGGLCLRPGSIANETIPRRRMINAMVAAAATNGYSGVSVTQVVARGRVSRTTFYAQFEDCEDCFLAAVDDSIARMAQAAAPAYQREGAWRERLRAALEALLGFLEHERAVASFLFLEAPKAGPRVQERRARALEVLRVVVDSGRSQAKQGRTPPSLTAETVVEGAIAILRERLLRPEPVPMMTLANPLMGVIVHPYLGPAAAADELERPVPIAPEPPRPVRVPKITTGPLAGLQIRMTQRTARVLVAVAQHPGGRNREIANAAGVVDDGQISRLLIRLAGHGLVRNAGNGPRSAPNAWHLTARGEDVEHALRAEFRDQLT